MTRLIAILSLFCVANCADTRDLRRSVETPTYRVDGCELYPRRRVSLDDASPYFSTPFRLVECDKADKPTLDIGRAVDSGLSDSPLQAGVASLEAACEQSIATCRFDSVAVWDAFDEMSYGSRFGDGENAGEYFSMLSQALAEHWGLHAHDAECDVSEDSSCQLSPKARVNFFIKLSVLNRAGASANRETVLEGLAQ